MLLLSCCILNAMQMPHGSMQCLSVNNFAINGAHQHQARWIWPRRTIRSMPDRVLSFCMLLASIIACPVADLLRVRLTADRLSAPHQHARACSHVFSASGEAWKQGNMDFTGAQMILTLKLISTAVSYQDGLRSSTVRCPPPQL